MSRIESVDLPAAAARVQAVLDRLAPGSSVVVFEASTGTVEAAAAAVGCEPGQIIKTLFFLADGRPTLALVAGDRQVDSAKLATLLGVGRKKLKMGSPEDVLEATGFEVGGVSPVATTSPCDTVADESIRRFDDVWAAAGTGHAVFNIGTEDLIRACRAQVAAITRDAL